MMWSGWFTVHVPVTVTVVIARTMGRTTSVWPPLSHSHDFSLPSFLLSHARRAT
jgi:hypothetical protein